MKGAKLFGMAAAAMAAMIMVGCQGVRPILPRKKLPPGTLQMYFVKKVLGPVELAIDGARIPVEQKKKKAQLLTISGLSQGAHNYFIASHLDIIGPDYGEFEIGPEEGVFQIHFVQKLKAALIDTGHSAPAPGGIPGVVAVLE